MSNFAIEDDYFEYGSDKFFRDNSDDVDLAAYGRKHPKLLGSRAYLEVQNLVNREYLAGKVDYLTTVTVNWKQQKAAAVEANGKISYFVASGQGAVSGGYSEVMKANVKLMEFGIKEGTLITILNKDAAGALKFLGDEGANGRIVNRIWIGMADTIEEQFTSAVNSGGSVSATVAGASLVLGVQGKGTSATSVSINVSSGTPFAYSLCKVSNWDDHRTKVVQVADDWYG